LNLSSGLYGKVNLESAHKSMKRWIVQMALRSTEAEVRHILDQVVLPPEQRVGLGTLLAAIGQKYGGVELNIEREYEDRTPDFS